MQRKEGNSFTVGDFDKVGDEEKYVKQMYVVDSAWDAPELWGSALISDKFVFGYWPYLLAFQD